MMGKGGSRFLEKGETNPGEETMFGWEEGGAIRLEEVPASNWKQRQRGGGGIITVETLGSHEKKKNLAVRDGSSSLTKQQEENRSSSQKERTLICFHRKAGGLRGRPGDAWGTVIVQKTSNLLNEI